MGFERKRSQGHAGPQGPVGLEQGIGPGHTEGHEQPRLTELQAVDHRQPAERRSKEDDARATHRGRDEPRGRGQGGQQQSRPDPVGDLIRQGGERQRRPGDGWGADVAGELRDRDPGTHRIELCLLQGQVVDRAPTVHETDLGRGEIEREVVVEPVPGIRERPLIKVEDREQSGGDRPGGCTEVAPPAGSHHQRRRLPFVVMVSTGFEARVVELRDGTRVHLRPITPEDEPLLHEAVAAMSERTVYFRFFSPIKRMSDALAHRLAVVDYNDRFAIVATTHKPGSKERIVGVARYDRATQTDIAEVAVAVIDEFQRRGLGSVLLAELARVARSHGIRLFQLIVLPENREMLGLLRKMGWIHQAKVVGGVYEISFELPEIA